MRRTLHRVLICGCSTDGLLCEQHRPPTPDDVASDPAAILSLALFAAMVAVWAAILG